ncbi:MAG TPA: CHAD domain-containing protein [Opitutaceae bacterium]|nr:CHAD domain-containing protein [Opitutaceae bacterium]
MALPPNPPPPLAVALKQQAMALDADMVRSLRATDHLSPPLLHGIRVVTKRLRAWWQLARPLVRRKAVRRAQGRLGTVAQLLAPARDVQVMHQTLSRLSPRAEARPVRAALAAVDRQLLAAVATEVSAKDFPRLRARLIRAFKSDAAAWRRLPVAAQPDDPLVAELARTYRRARRRARLAARRGTVRAWHTWRMAVKAHLHQMDFFCAGRRGPWARRLRDLAALGRLMGRGQDLAILDGWVDWRVSTGALDRKDARRVQALLRRRQEALRLRGARLGRRLFADKPGLFAAHLAAGGGAGTGTKTPPARRGAKRG